MKVTIGRIAFALWVVTFIGAAIYVVKGADVSKQLGQRTAIYLSESDRDLVLDEMRMMLQSTQQIVVGLADNDMKNVEIAAEAAGMGSAIDLDPKFLSKLPLEFKALGFSMHSDMDGIAKSVKQGATPNEVTRMLGDTLTKCVGCHSAWRIEVKQ